VVEGGIEMPNTEERVDRLENVMIELAQVQMSTQLSLKNLSIELTESQKSTQLSLKNLSDEMREFKDEMRDFKDEMRDFKGEMKDFKDEMRDFKDEMKDFKNKTDQTLARIDMSVAEIKLAVEEMKLDRKRMNKQWGELAHKMGTIVEDIVAPNIPRIAEEYFNFSEIEDFMVRRQVRNKKDRAKRREFDVIAAGENQVIINETKSTPRIDYIDRFIEALAQIEDYFPEYTGKTIIPIFASLYIGEDIVNYLTRNQIYAMGMGEETMEIINFHLVGNGR